MAILHRTDQIYILFCTRLYVAMKHMVTSFHSIEQIIDVQEIHGVDLGSQCMSRNQLRILEIPISLRIWIIVEE